MRENNRDLSVTTYEYYCDLCTEKRIRSDAKKVLKKKTKC